MKNVTPIWQEIWDALAWNKPGRDADPIHRFNRLAKEHFPHITQWLDQNSCTAKDITLSEVQIKNLKPWHQRAKPNKIGGKIILFRHAGVPAIVDGNNRVAHYLSNNQTNDVNAILVELKQ